MFFIFFMFFMFAWTIKVVLFCMAVLIEGVAIKDLLQATNLRDEVLSGLMQIVAVLLALIAWFL